MCPTMYLRACNPPTTSALGWMDIVPTIVVAGRGFSLREIKTVPEAVEFLEEWPSADRTPFFQLAENAMQGAINGSIPVEEARESFQIFCAEAGILLELPSAID